MTDRTGRAILAAAPTAPPAAVAALDASGLSDRRLAHLVGQCAHESGGLVRVVESLHYTTASRLCAVWPSRFPTEASARPFVRHAEALANHVYGGRMGNAQPGDGWRYRGRGYLQLTGRWNYRAFGDLLGLPLEDDPDIAAEPATAWRIAAAYLDRRKRSGRTAFEWADENNVEMVTRIVNGGTHGLADRRSRTLAALHALHGHRRPTLSRGAEGAPVEALQEALVRAGFAPGAVDGDFGPRTDAALRAFQAARGLLADGIAGPATWQALVP